MSRPVVVEPPNKRQRAAREVAGQGKEGVDEVVEGRGLEEDDEEFRRLEAVSAVQDELNALEEEEAQQVLIVHKAFLKRKRPLYAKRQEAIEHVPDFWLKVLLAHPVTHAFVADGDQLALSYLESIAVHKASSSSASASVAGASHKSSNGKGHQPKVETETVPAKNLDGGDGGLEGSGGGSWRGGELDDDDDVGFRVTCTFRENPFFSNPELWKEWESGEAQQAAFSPVRWKDTEEAKELQACLAWNLDSETAMGSEETPSFFSIFCEYVDDYEFGEAIRGEVTDNPLDIYMRHDFDAEADAEDDAVPQDQDGLVEDGDASPTKDMEQENGFNGSEQADFQRDGDVDDKEDAEGDDVELPE